MRPDTRPQAWSAVRAASPAPDSVFFLASITKAIVATAVMRYVDEGRLDLQASLGRYLPELKGSALEDVTAWHVLTHTSGLPDMPVDSLRRERPTYQRSLDVRERQRALDATRQPPTPTTR